MQHTRRGYKSKLCQESNAFMSRHRFKLMAWLARASVLQCTILTVAVLSLQVLFFWTTYELSRSHTARHLEQLSFLQNNQRIYREMHFEGNLEYSVTDDTNEATTTSSPERPNHQEVQFRFKDGPLVTDVDCKAIFAGDNDEIDRANFMTKKLDRTHIEPIRYQQWTQDCPSFKLQRGYISDPLTGLERDFPVAFSILMYKDIEQFERLLRSIYRPQNYYCIHVDAKTGDGIFKAVVAITECFENVFMASQRIRVKWGQLSVLTPELVCMEDLLQRSSKWKYFINLTGQEFPLKSNYELVRILKAFNGSNDVESVKRKHHPRWKQSGPPPLHIEPVKGAVHVILSRAFVEFALHDEKAIEFYDWTTKTKIPDETFFPTLNHNPNLGAPGAYTGNKENSKAYIARFKNTGGIPCAGKRVRGVCIIATGDLPLLGKSKSIFVNKLHQGFHPYAHDCLEELIANRTRDYYYGRRVFDASYYENLDFVKNKVG